MSYADDAQGWYDAGWSPLPLPRGKKWPPPEQFTGHYPDPELSQITEWVQKHPRGNTALRLPVTVVGIDVDVYDGKRGDLTLDALVERYGELPPTVVVTSREFDSLNGIRLYRLPRPAKFPGVLGPGIEVIQHHHRYCVAPGSKHPEGGTYKAYDEANGGAVVEGVFDVSSLPELPAAWLEVRSIGGKGRSDGAISRLGLHHDVVALDKAAAKDWLAVHGAGVQCRAVAGVLKAQLNALCSASADGTSRYDTAVEGSWALLQLAVEGHRGVRKAVNELGRAYAEAVADEPNRDRGEWSRMVIDGVGKADALLADSNEEFGEWTQHPRGRCPDRTADGEDLADGSNDSVDPELWPSPAEPFEVALRYIEQCWTVGDSVTLKRWRGSFYEWQGQHYAPVSDEVVFAMLGYVLRDATFVGAAETPTELRWKPTPTKLNGVMKLLPSVPGVLLRDEVEPEDGSGESIALVSGVLDVATRAVKPHSPERFALTSLPFDYDSNAQCDEWLDFLDSVWGEDVEQIDLLQEWMGYVVSGSTVLQKMMLTIGPPRSGKGVQARVLEALVGKGNHTSPSLDALGTNFGMQSTIGKSLVVISDARFDGRNVTAVVERLLTLAGGDSITIDRKNRDPWEGRATARVHIVSNELPMLRESSGALVSRFIGPLETSVSYLDHEDIGLEKRLLGELPGVLLWALDGLDRLLANDNTFTRPSSSTVMRREWSELNTPVSAFLTECCEVREGLSIETNVLWKAYEAWCGEHGNRAVSDARFGRDLRSVMGGQLDTERRRKRGGRVKVYLGLRLHPGLGGHGGHSTGAVDSLLP